MRRKSAALLINYTVCIAFVCSNGAMAADLRLQSSVTLLNKMIYVDGDVQSPHFKAFFEALNDNIDVFANLSVVGTAATNIVIGLQDLGMPRYEPKVHLLAMERQYCERDYRPGPMEYRAVMLHEFGHSVFQANIEPLFSDLYREDDGLSLEKFSKLFKNDIAGADAVRAGVTDVAAPFNELFADTVSVLMLKDGKAMSKYFFNCDGEAERDFTFAYPVQGWTTGRLGGLMSGTHRVFNPTRSFIWNIYAQRYRFNPEARKILLAALFRASVKIIGELLHKPITAGDWSSIDQQRLNLSLMDGLKHELGMAVP